MERKHYIDVAKGLLILLVVLGHVFDYQFVAGGGEESQIAMYSKAYLLYRGFYMQAFFFITGYVSNFNKAWPIFLKDNARTILFPILTVSLLISIIRCCLNLDFWNIANYLLSININYWFLLALFIGKIMCFPISKLSRVQKLVAALFMYLLGCIAFRYSIPNVFYITQSLLLTPFIIFGSLAREVEIKKKYSVIISLSYFALLAFCLYFDIDLPNVSAFIHLSWRNILISIPFALCGTIGLLEFCKLLNKNRVLEYLGRHTLVLFMVHLTFMIPLIIKAKGYVGTYPVAVCLIEFFIPMMLSVLFVMLLDTKYTKWICGKW